MLHHRNRLWRTLTLFLAGILAVLAWACNVPVFRYALERWEADPYDMIVFHRDPLTPEQLAAYQTLERAGEDGLINLRVSLVNLATALPPARAAIWREQTNATLPWLVARYPRKSRIETPAWTGPLQRENVSRLLESPARSELAKRILGGDSVVWLLLESGVAKADEETAASLERELGQLEKSLVLPKPAPDDPPMSSELPLKILFSTLRVSRSDPAEQVLVPLLLRSRPDLAEKKEPVLFPIFGRGRVMPPAVGAEIRPEALREMGEFLTGACSCEVKEMNPGFDLLLKANWRALPAYQEVPIPASALTSLSEAAAGSTNQTPSRSVRSNAVAPAVAAPAPVTTSVSLRRTLIWLVAGTVGLVVLASLALQFRGGS